MRKYSFVLCGFFLFFLGCNTTPKPLAYGAEGCHYCSMTIVDKQHAAQFMTHKGRTYSFDATECMMNHLKEIENTKVALFLVNDYLSPGEFIDATKATYLISESIPSPMGEFLTGFASKEATDSVRIKKKGTLLSWEQLQEKFKNN